MRKEKYLFKKPKSDEGDDGECEQYFLNDPQDFAEYCQFMSSKNATDDLQDEFYLRLIQHFVDSAYANNLPEKWVVLALADAFTKVLQGGRWEDEFPLPWTKVSLPFSRAEYSALIIYCDIANAIKANPKQKVTAAIKEAASAHATSYEKARDAYYSHKKRFSKNSTKK